MSFSWVKWEEWVNGSLRIFKFANMVEWLTNKKDK
jgi:hypothetical protein